MKEKELRDNLTEKIKAQMNAVRERRRFIDEKTRKRLGLTEKEYKALLESQLSIDASLHSIEKNLNHMLEVLGDTERV